MTRGFLTMTEDLLSVIASPLQADEAISTQFSFELQYPEVLRGMGKRD